MQYKRMTNDQTKRISGVDERFLRQLDRMNHFDSSVGRSGTHRSSEMFRLYPGSTFVKFAYPLTSPSKGADLTRGMYVPSDLICRLEAEGALTTARNARAVTHDNLRRWLSNDEFISLVKNGWIGTTAVTVSDIQAFVKESLRQRRITLVAAHQSDAQLPGPTQPDG